MRTQTAQEAAVLAASQYRVSVRVRVKNGSGTLIDLSSHKGVNWIEHVRFEDDIDQFVSQSVIELKRDVVRSGGGSDSTLSLSPLRTDSILNRLDDGVTFSPLIDIGREIHIETATTESWRTPVSGDWKPLLKGEIDSIAWDRDPVVVIACDEGKRLVDLWVEEDSSYGSTAGIAMETVMQTILTNWVFSAPTLYTPTSPSFLISPSFAIPPQPVMDALRTLGDFIGWDVRYRWHEGTSAFRLTLQVPPRAKTTPDITLGPSRILNVNKLVIDRQTIRNAITVFYGPNMPRPRPFEHRSDAPSAARYGRRWMGIEEAWPDSAVDTSGEAGALADAILADLKDPKADQEIELHYFWPVELWDLIRFSANGIHYNTDQDLAVSTIRHELSMDRHRTFITVRGKPAGQNLAWLQHGTAAQQTTDATTARNARRGREAFGEDGRLQTNLATTARQHGTGTTVRRLAKGHLSGTGKNGDAITFPENFATVPLIFVTDGGITYEPRSGQWSGTYSTTLPQNFQREAIDKSTSGFTLRGRLMQKGGSTARTHNFPASNNLDTIGETTELTLSNAPSANDQYTAHFSVSLAVTCTGASHQFTDAELVVAVDVDDGSGFVQRESRLYEESDNGGGGATTLTKTHEQVTVAVTGLGATDKIRLRIVSLTLFSSPGASGSATFSVHGFDGTGDPDSGVTYTTATDIYASMTPDAQDFLQWHAIEADA